MLLEGKDTAAIDARLKKLRSSRFFKIGGAAVGAAGDASGVVTDALLATLPPSVGNEVHRLRREAEGLSASLAAAEKRVFEAEIMAGRYRSERDAAVLLLQNMSSTKADYYFNSGWNRLDFVLLMIGYLSLLNGGGGGLSSLRALRALAG